MSIVRQSSPHNNTHHKSEPLNPKFSTPNTNKITYHFSRAPENTFPPDFLISVFIPDHPISAPTPSLPPPPSTNSVYKLLLQAPSTSSERTKSNSLPHVPITSHTSTTWRRREESSEFPLVSKSKLFSIFPTIALLQGTPKNSIGNYISGTYGDMLSYLPQAKFTSPTLTPIYLSLRPEPHHQH